MEKSLHQQTTFNYKPNDSGTYTVTQGDTLIFRGCLPLQHHRTLEDFIQVIGWFDFSIYRYAFKLEYVERRIQHLKMAVDLWIDNMNTDTPQQLKFDKQESFKQCVRDGSLRVLRHQDDTKQFSFVKIIR